MRTYIGSPDNNFVCMYCDESYETEEHLELHSFVHSSCGEKIVPLFHLHKDERPKNLNVYENIGNYSTKFQVDTRNLLEDKKSTSLRKSIEESPCFRKNVEKSTSLRKSIDESPYFRRSVDKSTALRKNVEKSTSLRKNVEESSLLKTSTTELTLLQKSVEKSSLRKSIEESPSLKRNIENSPLIRKSIKDSILLQNDDEDNDTDSGYFSPSPPSEQILDDSESRLIQSNV